MTKKVKGRKIERKAWAKAGKGQGWRKIRKIYYICNIFID